MADNHHSEAAPGDGNQSQRQQRAIHRGRALTRILRGIQEILGYCNFVARNPYHFSSEHMESVDQFLQPRWAELVRQLYIIALEEYADSHLADALEH